MKHYLTLLVILLLISTVTATQIDSSIEKRLPIDKKPIRIPVNYTNITLPINDTINITFPINETNITLPINDTINITSPINNTNITINDTLNVTLPINNTNLTINVTINDTNVTINSSLLNITGRGITDLFNVTEENITTTEEKATNTTTTYFYAGSKLIATRNEELTYHYQDRLGSDINSKTLPFGQEIKSEERFSFTGKELDQDLYYFEARYYNSDLGKFTSADPIEKDSPYSYVYNDPINNNDPDGRQTNSISAAELDSLITNTPPDTIQLTYGTRQFPRGSTVVYDYPNLRGYITRGVELFNQALTDSLPFSQAVARLDSMSWRGTVPYDNARTSHASRDSLEEATYGNPNDVPNLSEFFDGTCPDAICREYVGLTTATLRIIAEINPGDFNGRQISIMNIFGERQNHHRTSAGADSVVTRPVGHAVIAVSDSTNTEYISWGSVYTQQELEAVYERGSDTDPAWSTGGFNINSQFTWQNILTLF
jgi:RHS repeat-associated protein